MRITRAFGAYEIDSLPSQVQVAVCHGFFVLPEKRGRGNGHVLKRLQDIDLRALNYDYALCTVAASNSRQRCILERAGWQKLAGFSNRRTEEATEIWGKAL